MTWGNPPPFKPVKAKISKALMPEDIAGVSEHSAQAALFAWAALAQHQYPMLKWLHAIPNGGLRDKRTASMLKAEGVKSGIADVFLPWPEYPHHGLYLEMKQIKYRNHKNGGCSDEQVAFGEYCGQAGYAWQVCYSWDEAKDTIVKYLEGRL